jgi:inhibitor of cysteine peptidase
MATNVLRGAAVVAVSFVALAGCGDSEPAAEPSVASELTVMVGSAEVPIAKRATLTVDDSGAATGTGFLASSAAAAAAVLDNDAARARLLNGPDPDQACTEIFGGPDVARVTGTSRGETVDATFDRANGCGIADWDLLQALLGPSVWATDSEAAYGDGAHPIEANVGDTFTIRLESNATTGYEWTIEVPAGGTVQLVSDTYEAPDSDLVGAGGFQVFELQATASGEAVLSLSYAQPFDPESEPADTRTFNVTVSDA